MGATELSSLLWRERELLDRLTFKLETEQLLLTSGKTKWIQHAASEIEDLLDQLRITGLARAVSAEVTSLEWDLPEGSSLRHLAENAPAGPWGEIFEAHLRALGILTASIKEVRDANEQFLRAAARSTQETMARAVRDPGVYDSHGKSGHAPARSRLFDATL